ncbi:hypothetical protein WOLCODRAFT_147209 [Wolfiporia cocos MD-104 SS10]|uniref:Uncharacterized protein n=1 Tax=Wolfiporia cocos (strain MD-104) TaxID=742152 RepID=A0A2H3JAY5_WOLCO|nr:hypothetical protein WOLCODRAFT_147209 [Wolfiporia cocos MD-104 SS10]
MSPRDQVHGDHTSDLARESDPHLVWARKLACWIPPRACIPHSAHALLGDFRIEIQIHSSFPMPPISGTSPSEPICGASPSGAVHLFPAATARPPVTCATVSLASCHRPIAIAALPRSATTAPSRRLRPPRPAAPPHRSLRPTPITTGWPPGASKLPRTRGARSHLRSARGRRNSDPGDAEVIWARPGRAAAAGPLESFCNFSLVNFASARIRTAPTALACFARVRAAHTGPRCGALRVWECEGGVSVLPAGSPGHAVAYASAP